MTRSRDPSTFAGAVARIAGVLTAEVAGDAVGRSASHVYKWGDADQDDLPNLDQAVELDAAYVDAGCGAPPILQVYARTLARRAGAPVRVVADPQSEMLDVTAGLGQLAALVRAALDPAGEAGARVGPAELAQARAAGEALKDEIDDVLRALVARANQEEE